MMKKSKIWMTVLVSLVLVMFCISAYAQDSRPRLGLSVAPLEASPLLLQHLRLAEGEGLMVNNVAVGGALEQNGLSQGDILLAIDGHALSSPEALQSYIASLPKNAPVTLDVIQKGEHRQINMKLDSLPDELTWKYAQPVSRIGRSRNGRGTGGFSFSGNLQMPQNSGSMSQHMMFKSMISTPDGLKSSTVTIDGPRDNPDSIVEVEIGSDKYKVRIAEIDQLPDGAREAAKQAIAQSGSFSFSFDVGGSDMMEEMMKRHQEQMRMMDEIFNHLFMEPDEPDMNKPDSVLKPVQPSADDIRS